MQERELKSYADTNGYLIHAIYEDQGYTGRNTRRPALLKLMGDAKLNLFSHVIVWKLDRFARSMRELLKLLEELNGSNIKFISLKDNLDLSTPQGKFMMHILGAFAEFESDLIRSRVKAGLDHARANGKILGAQRSIKRDDALIRKLKDPPNNYSIRRIALSLGISIGMVQRSLKETSGGG